jgi:catechol 2,3-dioxygenase-like lactoylglutathione lyase family enzyme
MAAMNNTINFDGLIQIALVVGDIEKSAETWASFFGVPKPDIRVGEPSEKKGTTYRGKTANYGIKFAVIKAGNLVIELHEPNGGDSTFQEFYDKHGNGVHHLGFEVGDRRDAIIGEMEENGVQMRQIGFYPGSSWTIVDSEDTLGVNLNIKPVR